MPSINIFPENKAQGDKTGNTRLRYKSLSRSSLIFKDVYSWKLPATLRLYPWEQFCWVLDVTAGQHTRLFLGPFAPWMQLSEHRLAGCARPPTTLVPSVIHIVQAVGGRCGWWCPGDYHQWSARGGWTFFHRVSLESHFFLLSRHGC